MQISERRSDDGTLHGYDLVADNGETFATVDISDDTWYLYPVEDICEVCVLKTDDEDDEFKPVTLKGFLVEIKEGVEVKQTVIGQN